MFQLIQDSLTQGLSSPRPAWFSPAELFEKEDVGQCVGVPKAERRKKEILLFTT